MDFDKERAEALAAGRDALSSLEQARNLLSSARGWGIYDTFFSGDLLSGIIKHSKMDNAEECIERAKDNLFRFSNELKDLQLAGINLNTKDFIAADDIIFDWFLSDLLMQRRIKDAIERVDKTIYRVRQLISQLENMQ